jgi:hypothetical protein
MAHRLIIFLLKTISNEITENIYIFKEVCKYHASSTLEQY